MNRVLRELPKDVRDNGEEILHAILCGPSHLDWDKDLRLIVDGRVIQKTNIIELVEHLLYPERENADSLHGFNVFVDELNKIGLESHWVKNEYANGKLDENERMYAPIRVMMNRTMNQITNRAMKATMSDQITNQLTNPITN